VRRRATVVAHRDDPAVARHPEREVGRARAARIGVAGLPGAAFAGLGRRRAGAAGRVAHALHGVDAVLRPATGAARAGAGAFADVVVRIGTVDVGPIAAAG